MNNGRKKIMMPEKEKQVLNDYNSGMKKSKIKKKYKINDNQLIAVVRAASKNDEKKKTIPSTEHFRYACEKLFTFNY